MIKKDLLYSKSHEWVKELEDGIFEIGLTDHAQEALGDLVFVNLPQEGDEAEAGEPIADVESVKAVSDVYSPVSGTICAVNEELLDAPELINQNAYEAWLFRVENVTDKEELLSAEQYEKFLSEEE
ncbi:glycine cleavage system protein GcvH [Oscillospiraceae bacterium PP1C4]